ncbi:MAG: sulfurtransferase [Ideonella sp. MAG2]|nr:MAG: sulfurtransferase [Ideonella sp. MAG2]
MSLSASPLMSAAGLQSRLQAGSSPLLLDCSSDLMDAGAGLRQYEAGHVPGALYVSLDNELSGPKSPHGAREGGRHPLPKRQDFARQAALWGLTPERDVVVMDNQGGMYAARAWWLLHWLGHGRVQLLDGGVPAWRNAGLPMEAGPSPLPQATPGIYPMGGSAPTLDAATLQRELHRWQVLDARAPERFRGDVEPLDSQAGHIPGALNRFFKTNLDADGHFLPASALRQQFESMGLVPDLVVHQCGSGVTACHNLLAMAVAGLGITRLYPGSWSEWSADPGRPVAKG